MHVMNQDKNDDVIKNLKFIEIQLQYPSEISML